MLTADQSICTASLHTAAHGSQNCRSSGQASSGFSTCDPSSKNSDLAFALVKLRLRSSAGKMPRLWFSHHFTPGMKTLDVCQNGLRDGGFWLVVALSWTGPPTEGYWLGQRPLCPRDGIQSSPVAEFYPLREHGGKCSNFAHAQPQRQTGSFQVCFATGCGRHAKNYQLAKLR